MRYSKQRELIARVVKESDTHPTAEQVYNQVKPILPHVSIGTVYRNLTRLSEQGDIRRLHTPNGSDRFDGKLREHAHMLCNACGRILDMDLSFESGLDERVRQETGVDVTEHQLFIRGFCKECKKQEEKECPN
ncbi:MAG: transcriptional repressor [Clostridiales bacterium]|jgi:Fe2+ or Zn2+ uptake regulation protein|nr:transcriptional repressor [Clostridiales bacterium]